MEIEKKYLTKDLPFDPKNFPKIEICQCYISTDPTIRLRKSNDEYILTVKGNGLISRDEFELPLNESQYKNLLSKAESNFVEKTRYLVPLENGYTAEVDIYHNSLAGLITTEVEFPSEIEMKNFIPPAWFGKDVSTSKAYKNTSLSIYGIPKEQ